MSSSKKYCSVCINKRTCYIEGEDHENDDDGDLNGYCDECGLCKECGKKVYARVEWKVTTSGGHSVTLCRDVCKDHIGVSDCPCSEDNKEFVVKKYTQIDKDQSKDLVEVIQEYPI